MGCCLILSTPGRIRIWRLGVGLVREATGTPNNGFDQQRGNEPAHGGPGATSKEQRLNMGIAVKKRVTESSSTPS